MRMQKDMIGILALMVWPPCPIPGLSGMVVDRLTRFERRI